MRSWLSTPVCWTGSGTRSHTSAEVVSRPVTPGESPQLWKALIHDLDPAGVIIWLDADILVTRRLADAVSIARNGQICAVRDTWTSGIERFFPEWEPLFDLAAPCRREPYVNAGFFAFDVSSFPGLLDRWAACCRRVPSAEIFGGDDETANPLWAADQDALNALFMSELPVGSVVRWPSWEMVHTTTMGQVRVVDDSRLIVDYGGKQPCFLHYTWRPKPWEPGAWRRVRPDGYVLLLIRSLFGRGAAVRVPRTSVPRWLRPGVAARAFLFLIRVARKSRLVTSRARSRLLGLA